MMWLGGVQVTAGSLWDNLLLREATIVQTFEEIPREEHCDLINVLAGMASRWITVTMGQLGQGGGHHIANRHK